MIENKGQSVLCFARHVEMKETHGGLSLNNPKQRFLGKDSGGTEKESFPGGFSGAKGDKAPSYWVVW